MPQRPLEPLIYPADRASNKVHRLATEDIGRCSFSEPLASHSSWCIGGPADLFVEPESAAQIETLIKLVRGRDIPLVIIGEGSNLLFADAGIRGVVLKIGRRLSRVKISGELIHAEAGAWVPGLARAAQQAGLGGLEHCIGIPGTLGGLVLMNGGSHRRGIGENIYRVKVINQDGQQQIMTRDDCAFGYRRSALQDSGKVVVAAELHCPFRERTVIRREMLADLRERRKKFPRREPNCGSVFLSTAGMHASVGPPGRVIEESGLKGASVGQAEVSRQHANFIINRGGAQAAEVLELIARIRRTVRDRLDFELDCEVRYVDPAGQVAPAHLIADRLFPA